MIKKRLKIPKGGNQNPYIEEEQTTQWPKEKVHRDKQRSTKHAHKTKDQVTRTPLKTWSELRCFVRVSSSCSTSGTRRVNLVTNPVISHEWGKDREVFTNINKKNQSSQVQLISRTASTIYYSKLHRQNIIYYCSILKWKCL